MKYMSQIEIILGQKNSTGSHQHTEFMAIYSMQLQYMYWIWKVLHSSTKNNLKVYVNVKKE